MLQASSRAGLMKALGANNFKHDWFATSIVGTAAQHSDVSNTVRTTSLPAPSRCT